jgi:hypothetical protein
MASMRLEAAEKKTQEAEAKAKAAAGEQRGGEREERE